jgi:predicted amidohydrolase
MLPALAEPIDVTIAAAQMSCSDDIATNVARMRVLIGEAGAGGADVVAFPELAVTGSSDTAVRAADEAVLAAALAELRGAAADAGIATVFGMPALAQGIRTNCVYVIGPDGTLLTRHAQLVVDRPELIAPGAEAGTMWWSLKGVPAVVSIGAEALWSEIAELAAVRGALIHLHVCNATQTSAAATLLRRQRWACLASFRTLTATVNAASPTSGGSVIWEDFHRAHSGVEGGWAPHSAVRLAEAGAGEALLFASQRVPVANVQLAVVAARRARGTRSWWETGARAIAGSAPTRAPAAIMERSHS